MTIIELKDQIMKRTLNNLYVFVGSEIGIMNIYLNQMSKVLNVPLIRADSVMSIYSNCTTRSMFGNVAGLYVIRDDKEFTKLEDFYQRLSNDLLPGNVVVLLFDKIDSRLKFGKYFKDKTVEFEKLTPSILKNYLLRELALSNQNLDKLIDLCEGSYDMCLLEIDKIKQYMQYPHHTDLAFEKGMSADASFLDLLTQGIIYQPVETDVFKFTDAVCNRQVNKALELEGVLRNSKNSAINLLGTLYNSLKSIMLIQCCSEGNVGEITGLDNKQIYFNKKYCGKYRTSELVEAVKLVGKTVDDIKSGRIEDDYATRYVLSQIM